MPYNGENRLKPNGSLRALEISDEGELK